MRDLADIERRLVELYLAAEERDRQIEALEAVQNDEDDESDRLKDLISHMDGLHDKVTHKYEDYSITVTPIGVTIRPMGSGIGVEIPPAPPEETTETASWAAAREAAAFEAAHDVTPRRSNGEVS